MKLVVFSPLAAASAIGRVTALIVPELIQLGHDLVVVRTEHPPGLDAPAHPCTAQVIAWSDDAGVLEAARTADALIYQVGNSFAFHCGALRWLPELPGLVCLHDFIVAHLFAEWAATRPEDARQVLLNWYGESAAATFFAPSDAREFMETARRDYPMTEWICSMAHGVISHSHWGMARVASACAGPVRVVPLPYSAPAAQEMQRAAEDRDRVQVLTVGHANVNKRIESVISAIGQSAELRGRIDYRLCGLIEPRYAKELARMAQLLGVRLTIAGEVDDAALAQAMNDADIICSLRWPTLEAASASAIEGLLYGKAMVVTDTGFCSELPTECVIKIQMDDEVTNLRQALELLIADPVAREAMAARGQAWARTNFSASNYARQLERMASLMHASRPVIGVASEVVACLKEWGASPELMLAEDISAPLTIFSQSS